MSINLFLNFNSWCIANYEVSKRMHDDRISINIVNDSIILFSNDPINIQCNHRERIGNVN